MRLSLDTNVALYAKGQDSPYREPCRRLFALAAGNHYQAEASVELIQEYLHARTRLTGNRNLALKEARELADGLSLHPVEVEDTLRALDLFGSVPGLGSIDAVHAVSALRHGTSGIVSADRAFDAVPGLRRIDPLDAEAVIAG